MNLDFELSPTELWELLSQPIYGPKPQIKQKRYSYCKNQTNYKTTQCGITSLSTKNAGALLWIWPLQEA